MCEIVCDYVYDRMHLSVKVYVCMNVNNYDCDCLCINVYMCMNKNKYDCDCC